MEDSEKKLYQDEVRNTLLGLVYALIFFATAHFLRTYPTSEAADAYVSILAITLFVGGSYHVGSRLTNLALTYYDYRQKKKEHDET